MNTRHAVLVHGMGRSPLSMLLLARRLRRAGLRPHAFGYIAALESYGACVARLRRFIEERVGGDGYVVIGHSLGSVLLRAAMPALARQPEAAFFLAPPTCACRAARHFSRSPIFRLATGEMGRLLGDPAFMAGLPVPAVPTRIYAGVGGPRGRSSPFGGEPNDGVLALSETLLPGAEHRQIKAIHTFIMNSKEVQDDLFASLNTGSRR